MSTGPQRQVWQGSSSEEAAFWTTSTTEYRRVRGGRRRRERGWRGKMYKKSDTAREQASRAGAGPSLGSREGSSGREAMDIHRERAREGVPAPCAPCAWATGRNRNTCATHRANGPARAHFLPLLRESGQQSRKIPQVRHGGLPLLSPTRRARAGQTHPKRGIWKGQTTAL